MITFVGGSKFAKEGPNPLAFWKYRGLARDSLTKPGINLNPPGMSTRMQVQIRRRPSGNTVVLRGMG